MSQSLLPSAPDGVRQILRPNRMRTSRYIHCEYALAQPSLQEALRSYAPMRGWWDWRLADQSAENGTPA